MASKRIVPAFVLALLAALSMLGVTSAGFGPSQGGGGSGSGDVTQAELNARAPAPGTSGYVLTSNGPGVDPTYQASSGGGFANPATEDLDMDGHDVIDSGNFNVLSGTISADRGSDVPSTGDASSGVGNYFEVTGSTTITTLSGGEQAGVTKTYRFVGAPLITHAGSGEGAAIHLRGAVNWQTTAGDTLTLTYDGTVWREVARSSAVIIGTSATITGVTSATVSAQTILLAGNSNTTLTADQCRGHTYYADAGAGTTPVTLPTPVLGLRVTFVAASNAIQITAASETDIRTPTPVLGTADGGYLLSKTISASVTMESLGTQSGWRVVAITGTWAIDSTTSAGYAYTPTDWTSYTPDTGWTGGNVTQTGSWSQTGRIVRQRVRTILSGAPTGTNYLLQPVVSVDTTAMDLTAAGRFCGSGMAYDSGTSITWLPAVLVAGTFRLQIATSGAILAASGGWGASDEVTVEVEFIAQ